MNRSVAKEIINIFMNRDGMSLEEALDYFNEVYFSTQEAVFDGEDADEVWVEKTGLEPYYLHNLMQGE